MLRSISIAITSMFFLAFNVNAALIIDQSQVEDSVHMAHFSQPDLAQSFQQDNDNIAGAGIFLRTGIGSSDTVTISLWDALPDESGNLLASASAIGSQGSWLDVFWNPVSVISNTTYYLVFTSENNTLGISGSTSNPYSYGQTFANTGYSPYANYDYTFRTYFEDNLNQVSEPGSLALLGLGILGLFLARKQVKAQV